MIREYTEQHSTDLKSTTTTTKINLKAAIKAMQQNVQLINCCNGHTKRFQKQFQSWNYNKEPNQFDFDICLIHTFDKRSLNGATTLSLSNHSIAVRLYDKTTKHILVNMM